MTSVLFLSCHSGENKNDEQQRVYASLSDSTRYVGMATCRQCHATIYDSFIQTGMGQSFGLASREKSSAHFDMHSVAVDSVHGFRYHPNWHGDSLFVLEYLLKGKDTTYKREEKIDYIVGSGQHTNSHIRNVNGYLYQAPITYYTQKGTWDLPPGFEGGFNSRFDRKIELECMSCHNGMPQLVPGSENKYITVPNGIDCERCHGPGATHVKEKSRGNLIDTSLYIDYSIVNPSKLPIALQMDVCQRCHIQGNAVLNEGKSFRDFRPGMKLSSVMNVFMPVYKGDPDAHIMASHAERLKMSQCFIVSSKNAEATSNGNKLKPYKDALTCITCHNPHVSVRKTGDDIFNNACLSCHGSGKNISEKQNPKLCSETEEKRNAKSNNCVSCHMPKSGSIDIPHVRTTDHFIRKPISTTELKNIREFIGLACINNQEVDSLTRAKAFISYYEKFNANPAFLDSAKRLMDDANINSIRNNFKTLVHLSFLQNDYSQVRKYTLNAWGESGYKGKVIENNADAWTCYRIGQSYEAEKDLGNAIQYYQQSVELAQFQPDFRNKLASAQHDAGMLSAAKTNYQFLMKEFPEYIAAYTNYGFLMLREYKDEKSAELMYRKALALDPMNLQALLNMAGLLIFQSNYLDATMLTRRILERYPTNVQARNLLDELSKLRN